MKKISLSVISLFAPMLAFAQNQFSTTYIDNIFNFVKTLTKNVIPVLITIAVIVFIWEVIMFVKATPEEKPKKRNGVLYSIAGLFVVVSIFGILKILQGVTGAGGGQIQSQDITTVSF